jgi:hypothetical protein
MDAYLEQRTQLIEKDRALRPGSRVILDDSQKDVCKRADEIVRRIEQVEGYKIWEQEHEGIMHVFPGMEFLNGEIFRPFFVNVLICL